MTMRSYEPREFQQSGGGGLLEESTNEKSRD